MNAWLTPHPWWGAIGIVGVFVALASLVTVLIGGGPTDDMTGTGPTTPRSSDAASNSIVLDIAVFDDTVRRPPGDRFEIWARGHGSWFPDVRFGGDVAVLGTFPVGQDATFAVYPDGSDGREILIPFRMTADMISGSDRDRIQMEITDRDVVVRGTAIPERELRFAR